MNVEALRLYLNALADAMRASGAKAAADDLQGVVEVLAPFQGWTLRQWGSFLQQAEQYHRTGVLPSGAKRGRAAKPVDQAKLQQALEGVRQLEARLSAQDFSPAQLESTLRQLDKQLSKEEMLALAEQLGYRGCKTKKAVLERIIESFRERRLLEQRLATIQST